MPYEDSDNLLDTIVSCTERLPKTYDYSPVSDIQVLCPSRKGELGTMNLNRILRDVINPPSRDKRQADLLGTTFREGDKVMQIKNDYNLPGPRRFPEPVVRASLTEHYGGNNRD